MNDNFSLAVPSSLTKSVTSAAWTSIAGKGGKSSGKEGKGRKGVKKKVKRREGKKGKKGGKWKGRGENS